MPDPIRRQGASNPAHAGAFAQEGHGVVSPAAEKAQPPKLPTATQPPQLGKVARPPGAGKMAGAGAGAAPAAPAPAQPQAPLLQPPPPPKPGQLQQHLDSGQADAAHLLHSGDFPWHLATSADHLAMEKHLGKMDPPQFWSVAQQAAGGLAAQKNAPHAGHAAQVLKMAALHQPDGPTVPITAENQSRAVQVDWSKADPHEVQVAVAYLSGLPKVEGMQDSYYVPAGFDVQKFLGEKVPVQVSPLSQADVAAQQAQAQQQQPKDPATLVQQYFAGTGGAYSHPGGFEGQIVQHLVQSGLPKEQAQKALADMEAAGQVRSMDVFGEKFYSPAREDANAPAASKTPNLSANAKTVLSHVKKQLVMNSGKPPTWHMISESASDDLNGQQLVDGIKELQQSGLIDYLPDGTYALKTAAPAAKDKPSLSAAAQKVLKALVSQPGQTSTTLEGGTGVNSHEAFNALGELQKAGLAEQTHTTEHGWAWHPTEKGKGAGQPELSDNAKMALSLIKKYPGGTSSDIMLDFAGSMGDLHNALQELEASGHAESHGLYWHPTEKGKAAKASAAQAAPSLSAKAQKAYNHFIGAPYLTPDDFAKFGINQASLDEILDKGLLEGGTTDNGNPYWKLKSGAANAAQGPQLSPKAQQLWDSIKANKEMPGKVKLNDFLKGMGYPEGVTSDAAYSLVTELKQAGLLKPGYMNSENATTAQGNVDLYDFTGQEPAGQKGPQSAAEAQKSLSSPQQSMLKYFGNEGIHGVGIMELNDAMDEGKLGDAWLGGKSYTTTAALNALVGKGFLEKHSHPENPALSAYSITEAGIKHLLGQKQAVAPEAGAKANAAKPVPAFTAPPLATVLPKAKTLGTLPGSTAPKLLESPDGKKYVLKTGANPRQALQEHAADQVYGALGLPVPQSQLVDVNGKPAKLAQHLEGQNLFDWMKGKTPEEHAAMFATIAQGFAADALLANWDVIGAGGTAYDNIFVGADGTPYRIDNGGAFEHGGMGEKKKGKLAAGRVSELETMLDPHINPTTAAVFGHLTPAEISSQVQALVGKRDAILAAVPADLRQTIAARLSWMAEHYAGHEGAVAPESMYAGKGKSWKATPPDVGNGYGPAPDEAGSALFKNYADLSETREHVSKKDLPASFVSHMQGVADGLDDGQKKSLTAYTGNMYSGLNAAMRKCPETLDCLDDSQQKHAERIDRAVAAAGKFAQPVNLWRGISVDEKTAKAMAAVAKKALASGDDVRMPGFKSFSYSKDRAFSGNVNFEVKARSGLLAEPLSQSPSEKEFITAHNVRYKVLDVKEAGSKTTIWMEEL